MNRGDRREPIFKDDEDRQRFLETLGEACAKTGWQVHAYVLVPNHFHLVVETPKPNLVAGMKWFLGTYTSRFNRRHKLSGHLFTGRYKSLIPRTDEGCHVWNRFVAKLGWRDEGSAVLSQHIQESGLTGKPIETLIEFDEGKIFRARSLRAMVTYRPRAAFRKMSASKPPMRRPCALTIRNSLML